MGKSKGKGKASYSRERHNKSSKYDENWRVDEKGCEGIEQFNVKLVSVQQHYLFFYNLFPHYFT